MSWITSILLALLALTPAWTPLRQHQATKLPFATPTITWPSGQHQPVPMPLSKTIPPPAIQAASAYALDLQSATVLFNRRGNQPLPIASITKLVTVMVVIEGHDLNKVVTIPALPPYQPDAAKLGLMPGQRFVLQDLLQATLIPSANDAADALAIIDSGSIAAFTSKMNQLVAKWGIKDTHFSSASGLVENDNFASAEALARLAKIALYNPHLSRWVATPTTRITSISGQVYHLASTNRLLLDQRFQGIKTGYTPLAGQSLLSLAHLKGQPVIIVTLNSPDRFAETTAIANWIETNYDWY